MAFQSNAFQNDAFQVSGGAGAGAGITFPLVIGFVLDGASPAPVTVALTGSVVTTQVGTITPLNSTQPPQGAVPQPGPGVGPFSNNQFLAAPRGVLPSTDINVGLTGQQVTASAGTVTPNIAAALTGQAVAVQTGTLTPTVSAALSGSQVASQVGSLTPAVSAALSGSQVATQTGTITPLNSTAISVALTGSVVTTQVGVLTPVGGTPALLLDTHDSLRKRPEPKWDEESKRRNRRLADIAAAVADVTGEPLEEVEQVIDAPQVQAAVSQYVTRKGVDVRRLAADVAAVSALIEAIEVEHRRLMQQQDDDDILLLLLS